MKKRYSKILSIFLAMVMVVLLLPCVGAKAATVRVWINGKEITSANAGNVLGDGSMSYNSATNTLTVKENIGADLEIKSTAGLNIDVLEDYVVQGVTKITTESDLVITGGEEITRRCLFAHQLFINTKGKLVVRTNRGLIKYGYGPSTSDAKLDITAAEVRIEPANDKLDVYINECNTINIKTTGNMYFKNYQFSGFRVNLDCGGNLVTENNYVVDEGWRCCFSSTFTTIKVNNLLKIFGSNLALWCSFCHIEAGTMDIDGKLLFMASVESEEKDFSDSYIKTTKGDMRFSSETSMSGYQLLSSAGNIYIERQATEDFSDTCLFQEGTIKADKAIYITNLGTGKPLSEDSKVDFTATDGIYIESKEGYDIHAFNCTFHVPYAEVLLYESIDDTNPKKTDVNAIKTAFDYPKISILNNAPAVDVFYKTHIQTFGWEKAYKKNGQMSGTSGMAKRLEGINIYVASGEKNKSVNLGIQYTTHCQSYGWLPWSSNDEMNGTEGEAKRLEAIKIKLTGTDRDYYDVYYRVHAQSYGWLGWAKNGAPAGTAGYGKRLEGIQIVVVKKGAAAPGVNYSGVNGTNAKYPLAYYAKSGSSPIVNNPATSNTNPVVPGAEQTNIGYKTHVQTYGWQGWKYNGQVSGTVGQAKRLEGIQIRLTNKQYTGSICYTTHVQSYGWQGDVNKKTTWTKEGQMSGTLGQAKRLEAIKIALTGEMEQHYDIYYRVHAQSYGWLGWAKNGESAGTAGYAKRLEGIQIVLVPKGGKAPANNYGSIVSTQGKAYISK